MVLLACGCHNQPGAYSLLWEASPGAANTGSQQWLNLHIINSESRSQQGNCDCRSWVIVMDLSPRRSQPQSLKQVRRWLGAVQVCQTTPWCHFLIMNVNLRTLNSVWVQKWHPAAICYLPSVQCVCGTVSLLLRLCLFLKCCVLYSLYMVDMAAPQKSDINISVGSFSSGLWVSPSNGNMLEVEPNEKKKKMFYIQRCSI